MNLYQIALFLHVVGALGFFVALGLEQTGLRQIRSARTGDSVRAWMGVLAGTRKAGMASMLTILASGLFMTRVAWGAAPWVIVSLGAVVLAIVLTRALIAPRVAAIRRAAAAERASLSPTLQECANDRLLWFSTQVRVAIALGIVFLMTVKPGLSGSLLTIGVAVVLGLAPSLPPARGRKVQEASAE